MATRYTSIKRELGGKTKEKEQGFDDNNDIHVTMVLGWLIYMLGEMRTIAKKQNIAAELGDNADIYQLLAGDYTFIDAFGHSTLKAENVPARELSPQLLEETIERFPQYNQGGTGFASKFTVDSLEMLKRFHAVEYQNVFINNFDAAHNELELVYAITALQRPRKRRGPYSQICVVFRGSVELNDWLHNVGVSLVDIRIQIIHDHPKGPMAFLVEGYSGQTIQTSVELAVALLEELGDTPIRVHSGFLKYLFAKQNENGATKYDAIVRNLLLLCDHSKFKGYSELTTTGHSLGGALSTLLAFLLACDKHIIDSRLKLSCGRKSVTCISFASPIVGDEGFLRAFRFLEKKERLKHVRITNDRDFVPLSPPLPAYRHTGVHVHLRGPETEAAVCRPVNETSSIKPFLKCLLTTYPIVLLIPVYLLLRNGINCIYQLDGIYLGLLVYVVIMEGLMPKTLNPHIVALRRFSREKIIPVIACVFSFYLILMLFWPFVAFEMPELELFPFLKSPRVIYVTHALKQILLGLDAIAVPFIICWQAMMFANRPQDIHTPRTNGGNEYLGITHALPYYNYNLVKGDKGLQNSDDVYRKAEEHKKRILIKVDPSTLGGVIGESSDSNEDCVTYGSMGRLSKISVTDRKSVDANWACNP